MLFHTKTTTPLHPLPPQTTLHIRKPECQDEIGLEQCFSNHLPDDPLYPGFGYCDPLSTWVKDLAEGITFLKKLLFLWQSILNLIFSCEHAYLKMFHYVQSLHAGKWAKDCRLYSLELIIPIRTPPKWRLPNVEEAQKLAERKKERPV